MPILNPQQDPFLQFAEEERRQGKEQFAPWTTSDPELLRLAKEFFPEIPIIPPQQLEKPELTPVQLSPLEAYKGPADLDAEPYYIAVGGPPAAAVALEQAMAGKRVLYASDHDFLQNGKMRRPIWAGAGNHGEPDAFTEGPAYIAGHKPLTFLWQAFLSLFQEAAFESTVLDPDFPWLSLNWREWIKKPQEWPAAFRVAWGNQRLSKHYTQALQNSSLPLLQHELQARVKASGDYLKTLNKKLGKLLREPQGSLLIAATPKQVEALNQMSQALKTEGLELGSLTPEEAETKYGILPRGALALREKKHDFIFEPDFLKKMTQELVRIGGELKTNWRLKTVYIDTTTQKGGILEFYEENAACEKTYHYRRFIQAHLSLGPTLFRPSVYDLISVTGVSMNALLIGADLRGGPLVCGGTNHIVPLLAPKQLTLKDPQTGELKSLPVTFARLSAAASVSPLDRGAAWYTYDGRHAVHLLHRIRETLPKAVEVKILSVLGCNRVIGKDGRQVELHPSLMIANKKISCEAVTIQIGAGGGGLTQMGALPQKLAEKP
jgi:hypothetical protein